MREEFEKKLDYTIPCEYDYIGDFSEGFYTVKLNGLFGFAPLVKENIIIFPQYEAIKPFHEGYAAVKKGGKWGFIDKTLTHVTPFEFDDVESFAKGMATVYKNGEMYQIDFMGNDIRETPPPTKSGFNRIGTFHEGLCAVEKDGYLGFIDIFGKLVIPLQYEVKGHFEEEPYFSEGFACVRKGHYWGYIDKQNRTVLPFVFDYNRPIHDGISFVKGGSNIACERLLTCKYFRNFTHGYKIPFRLERQPPKPRYNFFDDVWSDRDLQDAYEAAYEI